MTFMKSFKLKDEYFDQERHRRRVAAEWETEWGQRFLNQKSRMTRIKTRVAGRVIHAVIFYCTVCTAWYSKSIEMTFQRAGDGWNEQV